MIRFIHKLRWAIYRIGMNHENLTEMVNHNKTQTENQKKRRSMLGGSARIVEAGSESNVEHAMIDSFYWDLQLGIKRLLPNTL